MLCDRFVFSPFFIFNVLFIPAFLCTLQTIFFSQAANLFSERKGDKGPGGVLDF